jgi:hypothetical protein
VGRVRTLVGGLTSGFLERTRGSDPATYPVSCKSPPACMNTRLTVPVSSETGSGKGLDALIDSRCGEWITGGDVGRTSGPVAGLRPCLAGKLSLCQQDVHLVDERFGNELLENRPGTQEAAGRLGHSAKLEKAATRPE